MSSEFVAYFSNVITDIVTDLKPLCDYNMKGGAHQSAVLAEDVDAVSDEGLIGRIRNGDKEALTLLFRRHAQFVLNVSSRILRDQAEAEDLLQDVFVFVSQRATLFDPAKGSAISWVIQIAYHRAIDRRRYLMKRNHYDSQQFQDDVHFSPRLGNTIDAISCRELLKKFHDELTSEQRETLELHFFEGYTFHEIAERTGQTFGNVRHHHYRGLERLRSLVLPRKRA